MVRAKRASRRKPLKTDPELVHLCIWSRDEGVTVSVHKTPEGADVTALVIVNHVRASGKYEIDEALSDAEALEIWDELTDYKEDLTTDVKELKE